MEKRKQEHPPRIWHQGDTNTMHARRLQGGDWMDKRKGKVVSKKQKTRKAVFLWYYFFISSVTSKVEESGQRHTNACYLKRKWQYQQSLVITKRHEAVSYLRWNRKCL